MIETVRIAITCLGACLAAFTMRWAVDSYQHAAPVAGIDVGLSIPLFVSSHNQSITSADVDDWADILDLPERYSTYSITEISKAYEDAAKHRWSLCQPIVAEMIRLGDCEVHGPFPNAHRISVVANPGAHEVLPIVELQVHPGPAGTKLIKVVRLDPMRDPDVLIAHIEMNWLQQQLHKRDRKPKAASERASGRMR